MMSSEANQLQQDAPGLLRTFLWGMVVLGFVGWVSPANLSIAALNLGEQIPAWLAWAAAAGFLVAPAVERYAQRLSVLAMLQALAGIMLLVTAGVLQTTEGLTGGLPFYALGNIAGAVVSAIGWAVFIVEVPASKRCSRLFVASMGSRAIFVIWSTGSMLAAQILRRHVSWSNAWALLLGILGFSALLLAMFSRKGLAREVAAPYTPKSSGSVLADFVQKLVQRAGIAWVALLLLAHSLIDDAFIAQVIRARTVAFESRPATIWLTNATLGVVALLAFPAIARYGLRRCMLPVVIGTLVAPLLLVIAVFSDSLDSTWLHLAVYPRALFAAAFSTTWTLYLMSYLAKREYVLSSFAWLTGLGAICSSGVRYLNPLVLEKLGFTGAALTLCVGILLVLVAVVRIPLDERALQ